MIKLFEKFTARRNDMKTLSNLIATSLERAKRDGDEHAGAHHLVLAALEMDDGLAANVLGELGADKASFAKAVATQESDALRSLGLPDGLADGVTSPAEPGTGRYGKSDATYEQAIKNVHEIHNRGDELRPLTSAYVLAGAAMVDRGVAARAFREMGVDIDELVERASI